jgi:hypothetical protein
MRRVSIASALAAVALIALPTSASAATQLGENYAPVLPCQPLTAVQSQSPGPIYRVPEDGVVTSWSFQAAATPPVQMKFKVARAAAGADLSQDANLTIVAESAPVNPTANTLNTYAIQAPVQTGDIIGLYNGTSVAAQCARQAPGFRDHYEEGDVLLGQTALFTAEPGIQLNISANLETDTCGGQVPTMAGTAENDTLTGTADSDVIIGLGGKDTISGLAGKDLICGGPGKDTLKGGKGKDRLLGQGGKDKLRGGGGKDVCKGGKKPDSAAGCEVEKSI